MVRKGTKDSSVLSEYTTGDRIDKMKRYPFLADFELFDTHEIAEHTTAEEDSYMSKIVPRMVGHRLPRVHDECYKAFMLAHFKPFHRNCPLVDDGGTVSETFDTYDFSTRAKRCMCNWEALHECEDEREAESLKRRSAMLKESALLDKVFGENLDDLLELPEPDRKDLSGEAKAIHDLLRLTESNWFCPTETSNSDLSTSLDGMKITSLIMKRWQADIKNRESAINTSRLNAADASRQYAPDARETAVGSSEDIRGPPPWFLDRPVPETVADVSRNTDIDDLVSKTSEQYKLNREQDIAFRIMTNTYLCRKVATSSEITDGPEPYPLRMFLTGPGGTGKTHVIKALMSVMERCGDKHALRFIAPTGSAAAINDGMTVHKAFGLKVGDKLSQHSTQTINGRDVFTTTMSVTSRNKLHQNFKDVEVLVIDEVSLLDQAILPEIDARCRFAKERPHWWFGGMMVIFTGDLYQFPPVRGTPVYSRIKEQTPIDDRNLNKRLGRMIWNSLTDAVSLKEQKRMEKDPEYGAAVQRLRLRQCIPEDVDLFNARVVKSNEEPQGIDMKGVEAVAVVRTNLLRHSINSYKAKSNAEGKRLITCCALDKVRGHIVPEEYRGDLLDRDVSSLMNKGALPGRLSYYIGMPVILRSKNISTDLKITNGAQGFLRHVETERDQYGYIYAKYAIVEFPSSSVELPGLPKGCFPISPVSWSFKHQIVNPQGKTVNVSIMREQMPFQGGFACTGQVAQGQTMTSVIAYVDEGGFTAYVAASRATRREDLYLASRVRLKDLNRQLPPDLVYEMRNIENIAWNSLVTHGFERGSVIALPIPEEPYSVSCGLNETAKRKRDDGSEKTAPRKRQRKDSPVRKAQPKNQTKRKRATCESTAKVLNAPDKKRAGTDGRSPLSVPSFGCSWDDRNWSCAYDVVVTGLFYLYHSSQSTWQQNFGRGSAFSALLTRSFENNTFERTRTSSLQMNAMRNTVRDLLTRRSQELFPRYGEKMIAVTDILDCLIDPEISSVVPLCYCNRGCTRPIMQAVSMFTGVCGPYAWTCVNNSQGNGISGTTQQWLIACLNGYALHSSHRVEEGLRTERDTHALSCSGYVSTVAVFKSPPPLIFLQLYSEYAETTRITLELCAPSLNGNAFYRLACVIYYTGSHFTARLFLPMHTYQYDSQVNHGMLESIDLATTDLTRLRTGRAHVALYSLL